MGMLRGNVMTVTVDSRLADQPARRLLERASTIPLQGISTVELCLRRAEDVDVELMSAIVRLHGRLAATGRRLSLVNASDRVHELLDMVGLTQAIPISRRRQDLVQDESGLHPLV